VNYDEPGAILTQILQLQQATQTLQRNRTLINVLFNGDTPYTTQQQEEENISCNINFLEGTRIAMQASAQLNQYFFGQDRLFTVRYNKGPTALRRRAGEVISTTIAKEIKRSRLYHQARDSAHKQVVLHGPGPVVWRNRRSPLPTTAGIEDILIPLGTLADMSNLDQFAIYRELVWSQLEDAAFGPATDPGWNKGYVKALLANLAKLGYQPIYQGNRWLFPEKLAEDYKEGAYNTYSSSMPKVMAWDFFYRNEDSGKWNRKMVLDYANLTTEHAVKEADAVMRNRQILYEREDYADDWQQIVHWYVGNCSNVAPTRFHAIRSVGYLLYGVCNLQNKMRCRLQDHMFQQLLTWFRNVSEDNREKLGLIDLQNFGIMPDGVSMVTAAERHVADWNLVLMGLNQNRQLMAESSSSFMPDMQGALGGEGREMTATETLVRQNTSITLTSAVLGQLADQSVYEYNEICRRFAMKGNPDPMAKRFREKLREAGIPEEVLDFECWEVVPTVGVGGGNKAAELTVTQALMQEVFPLVDASAQRIILRRRYVALTDDPDEAMAVVPEAPGVGAEDDVQYAQVAAAILMTGQPWQDKEGINHVVMATVLMGVAQQAIQQAEATAQQPDGVAIAAQKVAGAANVLSHVQGEIMKVGQASEQPGRKEQAKALLKQWQELNQANQQVGQMVMKVAEEAQGGMDGKEAEAMAKIQIMQAQAQTQREIATMNAQQKAQQREAQWISETQRKDVTAQADAMRKLKLAEVDAAAKGMTTEAEIRAKLIKAAREPVKKPAAK
jgi:hypothetical protein